MRSFVPENRLRRAVVLVLSALFLAICAAGVEAQSSRAKEGDRPKLGPPRAPSSEKSDSKEPATDSTESEEGREELLDLFRRFKNVVFIHYSDFSKVKDPSLVTVPQAIYESREQELERLKGGNRDVAKITSFELTGKLEERRAVLKAVITVQVDPRSKGDVTVDLDLREADCVRATDQKGRIPWLTKTPGGPFEVTISEPGQSTFTLDLLVPIDRLPTERRLMLSIPDATIKKVELTSPTPVAYARDDARKGVLELTDNQRRLEPLLRANDPLDIAWRVSGDRIADEFSASTVDGVITYHIDDSEVETDARLTIDARTPTKEWTFVVPPGERIRQVSVSVDGTPVEVETEMVTDDDSGRFRIRLPNEVTGAAKLSAVLERWRYDDDKPLELGAFHLENAGSENGTILVHTSQELRATVGSLRGVRKIPISQLEPALQVKQPRHAFRFDTQPASVQLKVEKAMPTIRASVASVLSLTMSRAVLKSYFRVAIRRAPAKRMTVRVPEAMADPKITPESRVEVEYVQLNPKKGDAEVTLLFGEPVEGIVEFTLESEIPASPGKPVALPIPSGLPFETSTGTLTVKAASNVNVTFDDKKFVNVDPETKEPLLEPDGEQVWVFRPQTGPASVALKYARLPRELSARLNANVQQVGRSFRVKAVFDLRSRHEPISSLKVVVPGGARGVAISGVARTNETATANEHMIHFSGPVERAPFQIDYEITPKTTEKGTAIKLPVLQEVAVSTERATMEIEPTWKVTPLGAWRGASPEAPDISSGGVIREEFVATEPTSELLVRLDRTAALASVIVPRASIEEFLVNDGRRGGTARFAITIHRLPYVRFRLPDGYEFVSAELDGELVEATFSSLDEGRVALPLDGAPHALELTYLSTLENTLGTWSPITLRAPRLLGRSVVEEVRWSVTTAPDRFLLTPWGQDVSSSSAVAGDIAWSSAGQDRERTSNTRWLQEAAPLLVWSETDAPEGGLTTIYQTWSGADQLQVIAVLRPFWVLVCSGTALLVGLMISRLSRSAQCFAALVLVIAGVGFWAATPRMAACVWVGAQWGVLLGLLVVVGRPLFSRRRQRFLGSPLNETGQGPESWVLPPDSTPMSATQSSTGSFSNPR
ncbi:hypothetical protein Pan216_31720 [Planctomycetes bacterium Pan216]|uniref:Uncharacterized protein n=1 Tax=Kolteria novifilia TaxID=2527975 RepID=A0A518B5Q6_9BACT|nr:hypothetical protein Pan216_31720 [Planctomycetes bacterium Pan216]